MLLQVHDELVLEVAPGERDEVEALVREQMGAAGDAATDGPLDVPLDVTVGAGGVLARRGALSAGAARRRESRGVSYRFVGSFGCAVG